jgi:hypothetical protein
MSTLPRIHDALAHAKKAQESFLYVWPSGVNCHHHVAAEGFRALAMAIDELTACQLKLIGDIAKEASATVPIEVLDADGAELAATMPEAFGGVRMGVSARGVANEPTPE